MNFQPLYHQLFSETKDFVQYGRFICSELGSEEVIGVNAFSNSVIRKDFTIKRVEEIIGKLCLPLFLVEENEYNNHFKIYMK